MSKGERSRGWPFRLLLAASAVVLSVLVVMPSSIAYANFLTKILREVGEVGSKAGKHGIDTLDNAASVVRKLPEGEGIAALAVHGTPEGHWVFVNRKGDQFTAGTKEELSRVPGTLLDEAEQSKSLSLYLTEDTLFEGTAPLSHLPDGAKLHIVSGKTAYPLVKRTSAARGYVAQIRPDIHISLESKALFDEAVFRLTRTLNPSGFRLLAFEPGGPKQLSSVPAYDPVSHRRLAEAVDPAVLSSALKKLKGQTAIVTGEVNGQNLRFYSASGYAGELPIADIRAAARNCDVNLIVLRSNSATQPGAKNWLWQTVRIDGLETALNRPTLADVLQSLTVRSGPLDVSADAGGKGRIIIHARPGAGVESGAGSHIGGWVDVLTEQTAGTIATNGIDAYMRNKNREQEYSSRIIPGIPSDWQILYMISFIAGLIGFGVVRQWFRAIWPLEQRAEYAGAFGYQAARGVRAMAFLIIFMPLAGIPGLIWSFLRPVVTILLWPFKAIGRAFGV